jgi:hypothetical protein
MNADKLLLANLAATLFLTGLAWSLQWVQLEILRTEQLALHRRLNSRLMMAPMAVEGGTAAWLAMIHPGVWFIAALALWVAIGYATIRYAVDSKRENVGGLKRWNLVRTVCWTGRSAIMLWIVAGRAGI